MRQLHVLGVSDDGEALLLGPSAGKASHRLRLDDKLRAAVRGQLSAAGVERAESALTPKAMQARLREGASPEEVAKEAQVPVARVLPYAAPVIAERERIVDQARAAVLHRSRGPNGQLPLGEVVDAHLNEAAGLKPETVEWTARRRRDGAWEVQLAYAARGGRRTAAWLWRPVERDLTALDASATRLAAEEGGTTRRKAAAKRSAAPRPTKRPAASRPTKRTAGTRATKKAARRPATKKVAKKVKVARTSVRPPAKPKTAKRQTAKPERTARKTRSAAATPARSVRKATSTPKRATAVRKRTTSSRPAATKATKAPAKAAKATKATRKATVKPPKPVAVKPSRKRASEPVVEAVPAHVTVVPNPVVTEPPTPIVVIRPQVEPEPETQPETEAEPQPIVARRRGERVPLPSWSDVLLGVAPPEGSREANARRRRKSG